MSKLLRCLPLLLLIGSNPVAFGQEASATGEDKDSQAQIEAAIQSYAEAFNKRDVDRLAAHWAKEGVYTSRSSGDQVVGREAIAAEFKSIFAGESVPTITVATDSIEFISPNVALERGQATVQHGEEEPLKTTYSVVYIKDEGEWLIDRVTEDEVVEVPSNYDHLKQLDWLIGEWAFQQDDLQFESAAQWTRNQNYISRTFKLTSGDEVVASGLQIIGWDPNQKQIRSWLFDSSGTFVSGIWSQRDDRWVVSSSGTLADGGSGSFTSVFRPLEDGNLSWQKINQVVDGQLLPNIDEIIIQRQ